MRRALLVLVALLVVVPTVAPADAQPSPDRSAPVLLARTKGDHDLVTLDARGRVLRYADTKYEPRFDVCLGGAWASEVDVGWDRKANHLYVAVARRELATMKLHDVQRLDLFEEGSAPFDPDAQDQLYIDDIICRDPESKDVYILGQRQDSIGPAVLVHVHDGRADVVAEEPIGGVAFAPTRAVAFLATGDRASGYALDEFDLVAEERRRLVKLRGPVSGLVIDPTGTKIAGAENSEEGPKVSLFTFDLGTKEMYRSRRPRTFPLWVGNKIAAPHHTGRGLHVYDERMRLIAKKSGWKRGAVAVGNRIYGAWNGKVRSTTTDDGPILTVSDPGLTLEPLDAAPVVSTVRRPRLTLTALGLIAFFLAITAVVLRSRLRRRREPSEGPGALSP